MVELRLTPAVKGIVGVAAILFFALAILDRLTNLNLFSHLVLDPQGVVAHGKVWQFFTFSFVHVDLFQLLFNGLVLAMVGSELEARWGTRFFSGYVGLCSLSGGLVYVIASWWFGWRTPLWGSTGAVYGLLLAYGILFSDRIMLFMMIFPMKAKHFVLLLGGVELFTTVARGVEGMASLAHLMGMGVGFGLLRYRAHILSIRGGGRFKPRTSRLDAQQEAQAILKRVAKKAHLKLVIDNDGASDTEGDNQGGKTGPGFH